MRIDTDNFLSNLQLNFMTISDLQKVDNLSNAENIISDVDNNNSANNLSIYNQQMLNFNDSVGYLQVANEALSNVSTQLDELNVLNQSQHNSVLNSSQKAEINSQMQNIQENITKTLGNATYNGVNVFSGKFNLGNQSLNLGINPDFLDISKPDSILKFQQNVTDLQNDISTFMNSSINNIGNFTQSLENMGVENDLKLLDDVNETNVDMNAYLIAQAHNQNLLSNQISQLLS